MTGLAPNQIFDAGYPVTAASVVTTQVTDLAASTAGKINFLSFSFAGHAAITAGNSLSISLYDNALSTLFAKATVIHGNTAAIDIVGVNLFTMSNMNIPFGNGLTVQVNSATAGDSGVFQMCIGYDRTF